jgi:hypothetical protein
MLIRKATSLLLPLLVCCEPLKICMSLIFPYLENKSVNSVSVMFFGSIPMKSLCSGNHEKYKHEPTICISVQIGKRILSKDQCTQLV